MPNFYCWQKFWARTWYCPTSSASKQSWVSPGRNEKEKIDRFTKKKQLVWIYLNVSKDISMMLYNIAIIYSYNSNIVRVDKHIYPNWMVEYVFMAFCHHACVMTCMCHEAIVIMQGKWASTQESMHSFPLLVSCSNYFYIGIATLMK